MRTRDDEGFTLIELLVVMIIIGLLAAIAIPVFMSQRSKAYRSAMASDLHAVVVSELAWLTHNSTYTSDPADLQTEGYRRTGGVTSHIAVSGANFVACTQHDGVADWLVYDSSSSQLTTSPTDCA